MKDPRTVLIAMPIILIVAAITLSPILPLSTYFWMPTAVYVAAALAAFLSQRYSGNERVPVVLAILFPTLFIVCAQILITQQAIPTRWLGWGRFPLGDAADFLSNSLPLLIDGTFTTIRGRPLANAFIAGLWQNHEFDLTVLSIALSTLCAIAVYQFGRVAMGVFGIGAGLAAMAVAIDFLHEHVGAASTEPIGFFLGTVAAALLLAGAVRRSSWLFAAGITALALTFVYRVGAVFTLPFLLLFPLAVPCRPLGRIRTVLACVAGIVAVGLFHIAVARTIAPDSPSFVNAPKSWYAVIVMGDEYLGRRPEGSVREEARWVQIFDDHPGLHDLPIAEQGARFLQIVGDAALDRPLSVIAGAWLEYADQLGRAGLFRFVDNKPIRVAVYLAFLIGLASAAIRFRRDPIAVLILLAGIGQILSIPFLHGGENRVHIGMAGMMAVTVAYGIRTVIGFLSRNGTERTTDAASRPIQGTAHLLFLPVAAIILSGVTAFYLAGSFGRAITDQDIACPDGYAASTIAFGSGSTVSIDAPAVTPLGAAFRSEDAMDQAAARWREIALSSGMLFYAPIFDAALYRGEPLADAEGPGRVLAYVANLTHGTGGIITLPREGISQRQAACLNRSD
ncbi:MAG: hypothetical protein RIM33_15330 [Alphaproteobacteria bacterium]